MQYLDVPIGLVHKKASVFSNYQGLLQIRERQRKKYRKKDEGYGKLRSTGKTLHQKRNGIGRSCVPNILSEVRVFNILSIFNSQACYRGLTGGFLLLQNFCVAISVSPHVCFILVLILISMFLR